MGTTGVTKSGSAQQLMDTARRSLSWHSYSGMWFMLRQILERQSIKRIRSRHILEAIDNLSADSNNKEETT